jgi:DNA-binding response OmpR family regulator
MAGAAGPILVVDHDEGVRVFVGALLEAAGFGVAAAESGESALALAGDVRPRLALVDVFLPGLSGYEVCHRLKTEFHVPVVLVSRPTREALDQLAGMLLGADACVAKPFMPEDLLDRVRHLVSRPEAA